MARHLRLILIFLALAAIGSLALGWPRNPPVGQGSSPEATVTAYAQALQKRDFRAMAAMVVGGDPTFNYSQLAGMDEEFDRVYAKFTLKIRDVKITGDEALVVCDYDYRVRGNGDALGGGAKDEKVPLRRENGTWKIVPYTKRSPTGYFFERFANYLAHPKDTLAGWTRMFGPTRNLTPQTIRLGKDRTAFLNQVLNAPGSDEYEPPYSGYKSMTMVEHTTVLWPVGRSDEVFFLFGGEQNTYFTGWRRVGGKPKRLWQVTLPKKGGSGKTPASGTLAKWLFENTGKMPTRMPKAMRDALGVVRPYAAYIEVAAIGSFLCWVVFADGTVKPGAARLDNESTMQDSHQLWEQGFFITPDEEFLLAPAASGR